MKLTKIFLALLVSSTVLAGTPVGLSVTTPEIDDFVGRMGSPTFHRPKKFQIVSEPTTGKTIYQMTESVTQEPPDIACQLIRFEKSLKIIFHTSRGAETPYFPTEFSLVGAMRKGSTFVAATLPDGRLGIFAVATAEQELILHEDEDAVTIFYQDPSKSMDEKDMPKFIGSLTCRYK